MNKKNILIVFLCLVIVVFGFVSYRQKKTIDVLNREIIKQAQRRQNLLLENYSLNKELDKVRADTLNSNAGSK